MGWNIQGKGFDDLKFAWPTLDLEGMDVIGLQELGGFANLSQPWTTVSCELDGIWNFYVANPPLSFRAVALGVPIKYAQHVEHIRALSCGICVTLKLDGCKQFLISAHLPHRQREDCIEVWNSFAQELEHLLKHRRHFDSVLVLVDTNYELGPPETLLDPNSSDARGFIAGAILQQHGFLHATPNVHTWSNNRGSVSKIDYVWVSGPSLSISSQQVFEDSDFVLGCDHRVVSASFPLWSVSLREHKRRRRKLNKCGKWRVDAVKLNTQAQELANNILDDTSDSIELNAVSLERLSDACSYRPKSLRYRDPPYIRDKIKHRKSLRGAQARHLSKEIAALRKEAKGQWLMQLLDRSAKGDFHAISYFNRRQAVITTHTNYIVNAGGKQKAITDLRRHFSLKYTPTEVTVLPDLPFRILCSVDQPLPAPQHITVEEIQNVINTCKNGKSAGDDGISYEFFSRSFAY